jgi:hypothetical protein
VLPISEAELMRAAQVAAGYQVVDDDFRIWGRRWCGICGSR